ncbi:MAG: SusC/RagA family TonB-linked outer membrane protein, partial [Alistipes sp.]|nr:SusC/RagA family TonB-linked outer membrane protein [Alistipes sp.]
YMLKSVGVVASGPKQGMWLIEDPATGEAVKFESGMRDFDSKYRQYLGSPLPKATLGWSNTVRFFGVDVTLAFSGQFGHKIFNNQRMFYENLNVGLNRYKSAADPVYGVTLLSQSQEPVAVSYYLEDGDYMKLDNATIGYTFNTKKVKYIEKIRAYVSGENLFCITGYSGLDPELSQTDIYSFGMDWRQKYPTLRTFSVGLNITFGGE